MNKKQKQTKFSIISAITTFNFVMVMLFFNGLLTIGILHFSKDLQFIQQIMMISATLTLNTIIVLGFWKSFQDNLFE